MPKSSKKAQQDAAAAERAEREFEQLRERLKAETEADMNVLRALMDTERQARGIEQAADDYEVGAEWRISESVREIDAAEDKEVKRLIAQDENDAKKRADAQIAAVEAEVEKKRAEISRRFEEHRAEYADKVFGLVIGAEDE